MSEQELKPCPFCGIHDAPSETQVYIRPSYAVQCCACFTQGPLGKNRSEAIDMWNALPRPAQCVEVKPLEWEQYSRNGNSGAKCTIGHYFVEDHGERDWFVFLHVDEPIMGPFNAIEKAKAAAESHHRKVILSAINARSEQDVWNEAIEAACREIHEAIIIGGIDAEDGIALQDIIRGLKKGS